jgi:dTDP-4-amino-4,6-dideoxygalactose transaminase
MFRIPLARPFVHEGALANVGQAIAAGSMAGDGSFGRRCEQRLMAVTGAPHAYLTPSATAALEMAALCLDLQPGDEVVMPSFTFPSTANAVALRGAVPVFCDVRPDTLNVDDEAVGACLGKRTKAVIVVHYAGNPAAMAPIVRLCRSAGASLVEDAAQALGATVDGVPAGRFGLFGALSFHGSKNLGCGEGGSLLVNAPDMAPRAEIVREKGTDRARFMRRDVDKYAWQQLGCSWVVSELVAAYLAAQLQAVDLVTEARRAAWARYHERLADAEAAGMLLRPGQTPGARHNGHIYYVILNDAATCLRVTRSLREQGIEVSRHYVPLHSSPAGRCLGRVLRPLPVTDALAERLLRLPLWHDISSDEQDEVVAQLQRAIRACGS